MKKNKKLHLYSIVLLDTDHIDEICQDIKEQYENGVSTCALFKMTLVPEGNPPVNKAKILCEKYKIFKDKLDSMGLCSGILVQATMGHGWVLSEMFPYQQFTNFQTGDKERIVCPYDEGFRKYVKEAFKTIASYHPDTIMLDDDVRLMYARGGGACGCELHVKEFNRRTGENFTREELYKAVTEDSEQGKKYTEIFAETQREAIIDCVKLMREGIDEIDPTIPGSYCCVGSEAENAAEIAEIMAGKGNPKIVRINNGNYCNPQIKYISTCFSRAAQQIAKIENKVDIILAETDTCPQNRYSTSASALHAHFTGSLLEGVKGAKQWITRLSSYEPESGKAYRKILAKYDGFYEKIAEIVPTLKWRGVRSPLYDKPCYNFKNIIRGDFNGWIGCVLERFGLPVYFSAKEGGLLALEDELDERISDEDLMKAFKKGILVSSDSAERLIKRGFGELLGVDIQKWNGKQPSYEIIGANGNSCSIQKNIKQIIPLNKNVTSDSKVIHSVDGINKEYLFPGSTTYTNNEGGLSIVFSGTPNTHYNIVEAFSFLNYSRKQQLIRLMKLAGELPVYFPGDEEVYLKAADMPDGKLFCAMINIGFDIIEKTTICCDRNVNTIKKIAFDGSLENVDFVKNGDNLILDLTTYTLDPVILIID